MEIRLELLLGSVVRARNGRRVGRVEEVVAERRDGELVVTEYHLGTAAFFERFLRLPHRRVWGYRVRWDQLDLSDPRRPRLTCPAAELGCLNPMDPVDDR